MLTLFQINAYLLVMLLFYTSCLYASLLLTNYSLRIYMDERCNPHITMETEQLRKVHKLQYPGCYPLYMLFCDRDKTTVSITLNTL